MLNYFTKYKQQQIALQKQNLLLTQELEWAHVFHDSIKGKPWLENLSLNIGRWAGSYSFFYICCHYLFTLDLVISSKNT